MSAPAPRMIFRIPGRLLSQRDLPPQRTTPLPIATTSSHPYARQHSTDEELKRLMEAVKSNMHHKILLENAMPKTHIIIVTNLDGFRFASRKEYGSCKAFCFSNKRSLRVRSRGLAPLRQTIIRLPKRGALR
jgi:hypothetical protein